MNRTTFIRTAILLHSLILLVVLYAACESPTSPLSESPSASSQEIASSGEAGGEVASAKNGPPTSATVKFGRPNVGSPFQPPAFFGHDASTHAVDALQPRTVVIAAGGEVTFQVAPFHKVAVYDDGTEPEDIDITSLEPSGLPGFPPIINDATNRIARLAAVALPGPNPVVNYVVEFPEPGRYLVICEVLPHFTANDMYGWVIVK